MRKSISVLVMILGVTIVGCEEEWQIVKYSDNDIPPFAYVVISSPAYTRPARKRPVVTILWDGKLVFHGVLPKDENPDYHGAPPLVGKITTSPGDHVLEVIHEGEGSQEMPVYLSEGDTQRFYLFGNVDGKKVLIEQLAPGDRPM
jgi:hypothetical protein